LTHSCAPSARPSFRDGTARLSLVANRALRAGDELTIAFVDVSQHAEESAVDARRRRRAELARGWRFPCMCAKCVADGAPAPGADDTLTAESGVADEAEITDESKVEEIVLKGEGLA
jgi:import receptor subunit TOM20